MAKALKKPPQNTVEIEEEDTRTPNTSGPLEVLEEQERATLASMITRLGGTGARAKIYRRGKLDRDFAFVEELPCENATEETIKEQFGGGLYKIQFLGSDGGYIKQIPLSIDWRIKGVLDGQEPKKDTSQQDALMVAVNRLAEKKEDTSGKLDMGQVFLLMQQNNDRMVQMMQSSQQNMVTILAEAFKTRATPAPAVNGGFGTTELLAAFVPVITELIRRRSSPLEDMKALKELMDNDSDKDDMFEKIIKLGLPAVAAIFAQKAGGNGLPNPGARAIPQVAGDGSPPTTVQPPNTPPMEPPITQQPQVAMFISVLLNAAAKDSNPESYADMIADVLPDEAWSRLLADLERPEWFELLFQGRPEVQRLRPWFEKLREILIDAEEDPSADEKDVDKPAT